jgi:adenylate kinase
VDEKSLVPDTVMFSLIKKKLSEDTNAKVVFDGFPKTLDQAKKLDELLTGNNKKLYAAVYLDVPDAVLITRLTSHRIHTKSGRTYNTITNPPKKEGVDDITGEPLDIPKGYDEASVKTNLSEFHKTMDPVINYFGEKGLLKKIKGDQGLDAVWALVDKEMVAVTAAYNVDKDAFVKSQVDSDKEKKEDEAAKEEKAAT